MSNATSHKKQWFKGVDSLRFVLAFIVLLSHYDNVYSTFLINSKYEFLQWAGYFIANVYDGTAAVIAFFIVSGFVIHYPNKNGITNLKEFWVRRFLRILLPLAAISIIGIRYHPERLVWSLACELVYYTAYPFMSKINTSWRDKFLVAYAIAAILIIVGAHNDVRAFLTQSNSHYHGYYWQLGIFLTAVVGLPCWLLGVMIAENIDRMAQIATQKVILLRAVVLLLGFICNILKLYYHMSYILTMNLAAIVLYKWVQAEITYYKTRRSNPILEKMGEFSYSIYICHPIIYLMLLDVISYNAITYPIYIVISIILSYVFYLLVEKPAHQLARRFKTVK
ncbi:acyltransferase [Mucilaginibacter sp.]|uniref:acyltransferase family protein n=1 Tax=Mucilaginibacter sp. TaxID=1882438 RepID=UPI002602E3F8|nr:acyltransferase [Mucilaginibacter sp.]MDB4927007.1 acyltransferase [Mucilaginibacter sp.]